MGKKRHRSRSRSPHRSSSSERRRLKDTENFNRRLSRLEALILSLPKAGASRHNDRDRSSRSPRPVRLHIPPLSVDESKSHAGQLANTQTVEQDERTCHSVGLLSDDSRASLDGDVLDLQDNHLSDCDQLIIEETQTGPAVPVPAAGNPPQNQDPLTVDFLSSIGVIASQPSTSLTSLPPELLETWTTLLLSGLNREQRDGLLALYRPEPSAEAAGFKVPILNPEIAAVLPHAAKYSDVRSSWVQDRLLSGLTATASALKTVASLPPELSAQKLELGTTLANVGKICADSINLVSINRREALYPLLSKGLKEVASKIPPKISLFGESVIEDMKKQKSLESLGRDLKAPASTITRPSKTGLQTSSKRPSQAQTSSTVSTSLNSRGPTRQSRATRPSGQTKNTSQRPTRR